MVAPLDFAKLDNLAASDSAGKLEDLNWFLLVGRIIIQLNSFQRHCVSQKVCQPSPHDTSSTGKRGTHREFLTILRAIPTCRQLIPYVPNLCMVPQNVALTFP